MFDLVAGFCHSQILQALVKLDIPQRLLEEELTPSALAHSCAVPPERMAVLLNGGVSLGLLKQTRKGTVTLTTRGAALAGVPGLQTFGPMSLARGQRQIQKRRRPILR